jgi:lipopolysaccharide export system ATP-binding protein
VKARLEAQALRVVRGGRVILRGVDIAAQPGEVVGVLGPSGAGKSTLFRTLLGEFTPQSGRVLLDGEDITTWPLWRRARASIGYIPQSASILWDLTVRQNLATYHQIVHGQAPTSAAIEAAATRVDLTLRLDVVAGDLSAGERRRLEFARAITRTPRLLVCDEPFAGVDPAGANKLGGLLEGLAREGVAVLLADHHVAEALRICSRAVLLLDGAVAVNASPEAFQDHPLVQGRYLGTWSRSLPPTAPPSSGHFR